jgi:hypothetical protein
VDVAQRHEEEIAREVRNGEHAVAVDPHEAGLAAAVRHVDLPGAVIALDIGGDVEGVGARDHVAGTRVERAQAHHRQCRQLRRVARKAEAAVLYVARAVAEALRHVDVEGAVTGGPAGAPDIAVQPVAPARHEVHAQQADRVPVFHAGLRRIARVAPRGHAQCGGVWRLQKTGLPCAHRRPRIAVRIDRAQCDEMQQRVEAAVLVEQEVAHVQPAGPVHVLDDADALLDRELARVPRRIG